jgi:uncharacterized protein YjbI with pentapeptide repeats
VQVAINIYFSATLAGGMSQLVGLLREEGATRIGSTTIVRTPIQLAEPDLLRFADDVHVAAERWTGSITAGPQWSLSVRWTDGVVGVATEMLARLVTAGNVDFAVAHRVADDADVRNDLGLYRDRLICSSPVARYHELGLPGLGASSFVAERVLALMDKASREALENAGRSTNGLLHLAPSSDEDRQALQATLLASGVARILRTIEDVVAGPRWQAPREQKPPLGYHGASSKTIARLQSVRLDDGDAPITDLKCRNLLAPFARLASTHAENLDIEDGKLPFAELSGARIYDARCGGVDLRAVDARGSQWIDLGLVEADLRWATFAGSRFPFSRLDDANCAHIDLTDAAELERATGACFDNATAPRWSVKDAVLDGASFRDADLRQAIFDGASLENARFDGANLTGASFRDADLTGATFTGANMTGADFTGAKGVNFD